FALLCAKSVAPVTRPAATRAAMRDFVMSASATVDRNLYERAAWFKFCCLNWLGRYARVTGWRRAAQRGATQRRAPGPGPPALRTAACPSSPPAVDRSRARPPAPAEAPPAFLAVGDSHGPPCHDHNQQCRAGSAGEGIRPDHPRGGCAVSPRSGADSLGDARGIGLRSVGGLARGRAGPDAADGGRCGDAWRRGHVRA